ncbi:MAG: hypothetical protein ACRC0L_09415, partial [Angustibacter sp.]
VLIMPVVTASLPGLLASGSRIEISLLLRHSTAAVVVVAALGAATLVAVAPAGGLLFQFLDTSKEGISQLSPALSGYAPGLIGFSLMAHLGRFLAAVSSTGRSALAVSLGWVGAAIASPIAVLIMDSGSADSSRAILALGICSSAGMTLSGALLLRQARTWGHGAVQSAVVPGWLLLSRVLFIACAAGFLGRITTDGVIRGAAGGISPVPLAVLAAALGGLIVLSSFGAVLALTDRAELRALFRHVRHRGSVEAS